MALSSMHDQDPEQTLGRLRSSRAQQVWLAAQPGLTASALVQMLGMAVVGGGLMLFMLL